MAQPITPQGLSCIVCRSRKIKCDGAFPGCRNCESLGVDCVGYSAATDGSEARARLEAGTLDTIYRASGIEKRRVGSCQACRKAKGKCDKARPTCSRCLQRGLSCHYPQRQRRKDSTVTSRSNPSTGSPQNDEPGTVEVDDSPVVDGGLAPEPEESVSPLDPRARLHDKSLPHDAQVLKSLTDAYFDRIASLRCLGFLHKPSFNHSLDRGSLVEDYGEAIVYAICAHGLRIKTLEDGDKPIGATDDSNIIGQSWAQESQALVMREIGNPTLTTVMVLVLLCEFALQTGQDALAFMLCGCCHSAARLLALDRPFQFNNGNVDNGSSQDIIVVESRRRVLWSCFVLDSIVGSGVNDNLRWRDSTPQICLPMSDQCFVSQSTTNEDPLLLPSHYDKLPLENDVKKYNLRSNFVFLMSMRTRILRLIRTNPGGIEISNPESPFTQVSNALKAWPNMISPQLQLTELSIYVHKELKTLEPFFQLHLTYHTLMCDLTRISIPGFDFPLASAFRMAPLPFTLQCQNLCRHHATFITRILGMMTQHVRPLFSDCTTRMAVYEATKIMIIYAASMVDAEDDGGIRQRLIENITFNMKAVNEQHRALVPERVSRALMRLLVRFGFHNISKKVCSSQADGEIGEVSGPSEVSYLSELAPFRRAYDDINRNTQGHGSESETLGNSSYGLMQDESSMVWNQQVNQLLDSSVVAAAAAPVNDQLSYVGDYTQAMSNVSQEITWDLFSMPDWVFQQQGSYFEV